MKILYLAPFPYGRSSGQGGATACANALAALAKSNDVAVLCFSNDTAPEQAAVEEMRTVASEVQIVPHRINKLQVIKAKLGSCLGTTPEHAYYFSSSTFRIKLTDTLLRFKPDLVITQFPQMAQYLALCENIPTVHDVQDAFSVSWYRRAAMAKAGLNRAYAYKQWRNWLAYEAKYYALADQCWTLSEQDRLGLTVFSPQLLVRTVGLPLTQTFATHSPVVPGLRVGFIGAFSHPPNREALVYLLEHIVPRVSRKVPKVEFVIAGRSAPVALVIAAPANVRFVGFVESLDDFYAACDVVVAPLLSGGGIKIKVAEAMCHGRAVVTTPVGAEGMPIVNGSNAMVATEPDGFAKAVCYLLNNVAERSQLEQKATATAKDAFSTERWLVRVEQLLCSTTGCGNHLKAG